MAEEPSQRLPLLVFTKQVVERRDSMYRILIEGFKTETILAEFERFRWRALRPTANPGPTLESVERKLYGPNARVVEDQVLGWKLRAVLTGDQPDLVVTAIDYPVN